MEGFNLKLVPKPFGLKNSSFYCYFNSFIQALATCSSVNRYLFRDLTFSRTRNSSFESTSDDSRSGNQGESSLILKGYVSMVYSNMKDMGFTPVIDIDGIKNSFSVYLKKTAAKETNERAMFGRGQEDAQEGFLYLLEMMGDNVRSFFNVRYRQYKQCCSCGKKELIINNSTDRYLKENSPFIRITLDQFTKYNEDFTKTLKYREELIEEYKCDHCHQVTKMIKTEYLSKISEVLVICIDNYLSTRPLLNLPEQFEIEGNEHPLKYQLIATVEHFGSLNGGHYISKVMRNDLRPEYICNDSHVLPGKVSVTQNTYLAFYHIV